MNYEQVKVQEVLRLAFARRWGRAAREQSGMPVEKEKRSVKLGGCCWPLEQFKRGLPTDDGTDQRWH